MSKIKFEKQSVYAYLCSEIILKNLVLVICIIEKKICIIRNFLCIDQCIYLEFDEKHVFCQHMLFSGFFCKAFSITLIVIYRNMYTWHVQLILNTMTKQIIINMIYLIKISITSVFMLKTLVTRTNWCNFAQS